VFLWRPAIPRFKCQKKIQPLGDYWLLKFSTLKVKMAQTKPDEVPT
jgi:hypothetical protein